MACWGFVLWGGTVAVVAVEGMDPDRDDPVRWAPGGLSVPGARTVA